MEKWVACGGTIWGRPNELAEMFRNRWNIISQTPWWLITFHKYNWCQISWTHVNGGYFSFDDETVSANAIWLFCFNQSFETKIKIYKNFQKGNTHWHTLTQTITSCKIQKISSNAWDALLARTAELNSGNCKLNICLIHVTFPHFPERFFGF